MITQTEVLSLFDYKDGNLLWKDSPRRSVLAGSVAGSLNHAGYMRVMINKKSYMVHRLVFLIHHGRLPTMVDHINGIKNDNRIENLRECDMSQNCQNIKLKSNNKSGVKGVSWDKWTNQWRVTFKLNGKQQNIGRFDSLEEATLAANEARTKLHGEFAHYG